MPRIVANEYDEESGLWEVFVLVEGEWHRVGMFCEYSEVE